jgi:hypothetical protein
MGLLSSIGGMLGGKSAGYTSGYKNQVDDTLSGWDQAMDEDVGDGAYNRDMGQYSEGLANAIGNMDAAGYGRLRVGGFRDPSGGTGLHGATYGQGMANAAVNIRNGINQRRKGWLTGKAGLLQGFADRYKTAARPGLAGALGSLAGAYFGGPMGAQVGGALGGAFDKSQQTTTPSNTQPVVSGGGLTSLSQFDPEHALDYFGK